MRILQRAAFAVLAAAFLAGCATQLTTYSPMPNQVVVFQQGVGEVTWETKDFALSMYPTFRYQSLSEIPTFTLVVQNKTNHDIDFAPESINAWLDNQQSHVYTLEERISEIRSRARRKQVTLAILSGVLAGAAGYASSHQTATYSSYGTTRYGTFVTSGTIRFYDPASGILAGSAVASAGGAGIYQIANAAGYEERAAQAIFQRTTVHPGVTIIGQVLLKTQSQQFRTIRLDVPVGDAQTTFMFVKRTTGSDGGPGSENQYRAQNASEHMRPAADQAQRASTDARNAGTPIVATNRTEPIPAPAPAGGPTAETSHVRLGVHCKELTPEVTRAYHLPSDTGVQVATIEAGSVAEAGGIKVGDVITKYGDRSMREIPDLMAAISVTPKGTDVPITIWRRSGESVVDVHFLP